MIDSTVWDCRTLLHTHTRTCMCGALFDLRPHPSSSPHTQPHSDQSIPPNPNRIVQLFGRLVVLETHILCILGIIGV